MGNRTAELSMSSSKQERLSCCMPPQQNDYSVALVFTSSAGYPATKGMPPPSSGRVNATVRDRTSNTQFSTPTPDSMRDLCATQVPRYCMIVHDVARWRLA